MLKNRPFLVLLQRLRVDCSLEGRLKNPIYYCKYYTSKHVHQLKYKSGAEEQFTKVRYQELSYDHVNLLYSFPVSILRKRKQNFR